MLVKYLPNNEDVSLWELENVGKAWLALAIIPGPCTNGDGFSTVKMTLSSLSLANTGIPSLDSLLLYQHCCTCSESVYHSIYIVPKC